MAISLDDALYLAIKGALKLQYGATGRTSLPPDQALAQQASDLLPFLKEQLARAGLVICDSDELDRVRKEMEERLRALATELSPN